MYKMFVTLLVSGIFYSAAFAQEQDTTYFDENWSVTTKAAATYYRPTPAKERDGFRIKDYFRSGALQMSGFSSSATEELFEGEVIWYYESGQTEQKGTYSGGTLNGTFTSYDREGKLLAEGIYEDGQYYGGMFYRDGSYYQILDEYADGEMIKETVTDYAGGTKARIVWESTGDQSKVTYYGADGAALGESTWSLEGTIQDGLYVVYAYMPMVPLMFAEYTDGTASDTIKWMYASGELKKITIMDGEYRAKETYYSREGKVMDHLVLQEDMPYTGTYYLYNEDLYLSAKSDLLISKETYQAGILSGPYTLYDDAGKVQETGVYKNGQKDGEVLFYSPQGAVASKGTYKMGEKMSGTFRENQNELEVYEKGVMKESRSFYPGGVRLQKVVKTGVSADFYDSLGTAIGHLVYKNQLPYEGLMFEFYETVVIKESEYRAGNVIRTKDYDWSGFPQTEYYYTTEGAYTRSASFYTTGEKKSLEESDENYYRTTIYFDKKGNQIGKLIEAEVKDGEQIEFSEDLIFRIIRYKHGGMVYEKRFSESDKVLFEVDYNGKAAFYDENGRLLSTAVYQGGEPWEGTIYTYEEYSNLVSTKETYKNGAKDGAYVIYGANYETGKPYVAAEGTYVQGLLDGVWKEYAEDRQVSSTTYQAGKKEGKATFYAAEGSVLSEVIYKEDLPYSGEFYTFDEYGELSTITHYVNGVQEGAADTYYSGQLYSRDIYHQNQLTEQYFYREGEESNKLTYKDGEPYDGVLEAYTSLTYYKKGKLIKEITYNDYDFQEVSTETVYDEKSGKAVTTAYFSAGGKQSVIPYEAGNKNGVASFFGADGSLLGKGTYEDDLPIAGTFVYYDYYSATSYLEVEVGEWTITATAYEDGAIKTSLQSKLEYLATEAEKNEHIMEFYQMLSCGSMAEGYTLEYFY